jgi:glutathione peroxidase
MTAAQSLKKSFYPALKAVGKWLGYNGKMVQNDQGIAPIQPIYPLTTYSNLGELISLHTYKNRYLLIANTASDCGYTAQYAELQALQDTYSGKVQVLAFPANDFAGQEPSNDDEIAEFCGVNFGVQFPVMLKSSVLGSDKNPVFNWLTNRSLNGWNSQEPGWNFCKYLIDPQGKLLGVFESAISPLDEKITRLIR